MKKRQVYKGHSFSLRVPEKIRYGLDLLARRRGIQMSALVGRAIETLLETEGLAAKRPGEVVTLLDRIWSEDEPERVAALVRHAPELATPGERQAAATLERFQARYQRVSDLIGRPALSGKVLDAAWLLIKADAGLAPLVQTMGVPLTVNLDRTVLAETPELVGRFNSNEAFVAWIES